MKKGPRNELHPKASRGVEGDLRSGVFALRVRACEARCAENPEVFAMLVFGVISVVDGGGPHGGAASQVRVDLLTGAEEA